MLNLTLPIQKTMCRSIALMALFVTACAPINHSSKPVKVVEGVPSTATATTTLLKAADPEALLEQAAGSLSPERERLQLQAAKALSGQREYLRAYQVLQPIDASQLPDHLFTEYSLLYAQQASLNDEFLLAESLLNAPRIQQLAPQFSSSERRQWHSLRGETLSLLGKNKEAIGEFLTLSALATTNTEKAAANEQLWQLLNRLPSEALTDLQQYSANESLRQWSELAMVAKNNQGSIHQQLYAIDQWRQSHPNHTVNMAPPPSLNALKQAANTQPQQLAMLLPMSGSLGKAGAAIRDGFLSAWYQAKGSQGTAIPVKFYNTAGADASVLYQQAVSDGAQLIIGPVTKGNVDKVLTLDSLPVPTISLNYLENPSRKLPNNFYQFGLSAAEEARQVAERAWREGKRSALVITPKSGSGKRAAAAFSQYWARKGGQVVKAPDYARRQADFTSLLKPIMHIRQSADRKKRLEKLLKQDLASKVRRRQDLDMVFMMAYPQQARQIKPALDFLYASDLPVYGTSLLFTGEQDPSKNQDLDRIRFSAMPWTMDSNISTVMTPAMKLHPVYRHMYALGADAYQLHQWINQLALLSGTQINGHTGSLNLNRHGAVQRLQPWGVFNNGLARSF